MSVTDLFVVGLNHRTASVAVRERYSVPGERLAEVTDCLRTSGGLRETVVLSTCNRTELYAIRSDVRMDPRELFASVIGGEANAGGVAAALEESLYVHEGESCAHHLFRVASSLDSLVVGETEIVGQVKKAYQQAHARGSTGKILNRLFQKALSVSKAVRTRSGVGRCSTSAGAVSVDLANQLFGEDLRDKVILIVGAGKMGETTLRHLSKHGARAIFVCNRSFERARELASRFNGQPVPFHKLPTALAEADIVISSTGAPHPVITRENLVPAMKLRRNRLLFLIDLAVPRDVDPRAEELESVYLYNIDQLGAIARQNLVLRQSEAVIGEQLVAQFVGEFIEQVSAPAPRECAAPLWPIPKLAALQLAPAPGQ